MTRWASILDRLAAFVLGLLLIALGVGLLVWNTDWLAGIPQMITAPALLTAAGTAWWPWAVAAAGIVLTLGALRWLLTHTPKEKVKTVRLAADKRSGSITADLGAVADAAARALEQSSDVHSARGKAIIDRGTRTVDLTVIAYSPSNLTVLIEPIDSVCTQVAEMMGDNTIATRTSIRFDNHSRREHRVE